MPLLYACVACNSVVLADHADVTGNFEAATQQILDRTEGGKFSRHTYSVKSYNYHVLTKDGFTYLTIADQDFPKRISFSFLEKVDERFNSGNLPVRAKSAKPYELRRDFSPILNTLLTQYNKPREVDGMSDLHGQVEDVKGVMNQNIEKIIQRGENLDSLEQKTGELSFNATRFKSSSVRLQRKMWWQNAKCMISIVTISVVVITMAVLVILWQEGVFKKKN